MSKVQVAPARAFLLEACQARDRDWLGETVSSWRQGGSLIFLKSGRGVSHYSEQRTASLRERGMSAPPPWTILGCRVTGTLSIHRAIGQLCPFVLFVCWLRKGAQCFPLPILSYFLLIVPVFQILLHTGVNCSVTSAAAFPVRPSYG